MDETVSSIGQADLSDAKGEVATEQVVQAHRFESTASSCAQGTELREDAIPLATRNRYFTLYAPDGVNAIAFRFDLPPGG